MTDAKRSASGRPTSRRSKMMNGLRRLAPGPVSLLLLCGCSPAMEWTAVRTMVRTAVHSIAGEHPHRSKRETGPGAKRRSPFIILLRLEVGRPEALLLASVISA